MKTETKDNWLLLFCALVCSGMAWVFWHFLGEHGFVVLMAVVMLALVADNYRLRRRLRRRA